METTLYYIIGVIVGLTTIYLFYRYAKTKGWATKSAVERVDGIVDDVIEVADAILDVLDKKNVAVNSLTKVLDVADIVTDYVVKLEKADNADVQYNLSLASIQEVLTKLNIEVSESQQRLINIVVEQGIEFVTGEEVHKSTPVI